MPFSKLIKGYKEFQTKYFKGSEKENNLYQTLSKHGQNPEVLVIACSDSRNDPALLTQSEPGDIFVVRNVAAIVPPYQPDSQYHGTSAAIEFAVKGLRIKDIIVLGHALCGGVEALLTGKNASQQFEFLSNWIEIGASARNAVTAELAHLDKSIQLRALEQAVIMTSLNNLMTFPWIKDGVAAGNITLHGWYFDMVSGKILGLDFASGTFGDISQSSLAEAFSKRSTHYCDCSIQQIVDGHK
jgi:carbonic anhydrase